MNPKDDVVDEGKICPHCRKTSQHQEQTHAELCLPQVSVQDLSVISELSATQSSSYPAPRGPPDGTHLPVYYTSLSHCTIPGWI